MHTIEALGHKVSNYWRSEECSHGWHEDGSDESIEFGACPGYEDGANGQKITCDCACHASARMNAH
jgi:hypothetical protein